MDIGDKDALRDAIDRLKRRLNVEVGPDLVRKYLVGQDPMLLAYDRLHKGQRLPVVVKYFLGCEGYLQQPDPDSFYDIFRAARMVPLVRILDRALDGAEAKIAVLDERVAKLATLAGSDEFDSALYEIVAARAYSDHPDITDVAFIPEDRRSKTPDFGFSYRGERGVVECKKLARMTDAATAIRSDVQKKSQPIIDAVLATGESAVVSIVFHDDPLRVSGDTLAHLARTAIRARSPIVTRQFTIEFQPKAPAQFRGWFLVPSPQYYIEQYGFDSAGPWQGIVTRMSGNRRSPTTIDAVEWECAVKWRIDNDDVLWKLKRLSFQTLLKGLDQLKAVSDNGILHVGYERDLPVGHRQPELMAFLRELVDKAKTGFSALVFNELAISVSPEGRFEFVEHAHPATVRRGNLERPPVTAVFIRPDDLRAGEGPWGIGHELPPIDDEMRLKPER